MASKNEAVEAFFNLRETTMGKNGFAMVIIDIQSKTTYIKQLIDEIEGSMEKHDIPYKPKYVVMSAELADEGKVERMKSIGVEGILVKPLMMGDLMKFFKSIKYNYKPFT